ncbi:hypothetical protein SE17_00730 [Kouleothrix aurantiaca]|uniref:Uncharacterized protein n=1 Tax=Kouleothrix aurantiaca TaxID=186479 RepID=A0A0P9FDT7_9CHLR|nr:hypothetical protein SE17_00730 [Kouleothrix aurantiaca]
MDNPFMKRATEFLRDEEAFLALVSPEPVRYFLHQPGASGVLYDRLVLIQGTPGSGKTTLARLFTYPAVATLLRNSSMSTYQPLVHALRECGGLTDRNPSVVGCRLPLETDYRDFWEFPYSDELKMGLMMALVQARAVLGWFRNLMQAGVDLSRVSIVPRADADAATAAIGGVIASDIMERARSVERSIYDIIGALVAPELSQLPIAATSAYRPFDVIDHIHIVNVNPDTPSILSLRPLVMLDDAHTLHPAQFRGLIRWLTRRELRVARWVLTRFDVFHPRESLTTISDEQATAIELPGITATRDTVDIRLQSGVTDRTEQRQAFRRMAKDMSGRYLRQMSLFSSRNLSQLTDLLSTESEPLAPTKLHYLEASISNLQHQLHITDSRCATLLATVDAYRFGKQQIPDDVRLAMLAILLHRYAKRTAQRHMFEEDPDPAKPIEADSTVYNAARLHLLHQHDRPYYVGIDAVCDASSENAEQFLRLAAILVAEASTQLIRGRSPSLNARTQNLLLRQRAGEILDVWDFPQCKLVRHLVGGIATQCLSTSLEPNAWLGSGANAYGIRQLEFDELPEKYPQLAQVLHYAIAYNAVTLIPHYQCKDQEWCLLELGGMVILHHGLTLFRGGFLEGTAKELLRMLQGETQ